MSEELGKEGPYHCPGWPDVVWDRDHPLLLHAQLDPVLKVHPVGGAHSSASGLESSRSRSAQDTPPPTARAGSSLAAPAKLCQVCCYSNLPQRLEVWPSSNLMIVSPIGAWDQVATFISLHFGGRRGLRIFSAFCRKRKSIPCM